MKRVRKPAEIVRDPDLIGVSVPHASCLTSFHNTDCHAVTLDAARPVVFGIVPMEGIMLGGFHSGRGLFLARSLSRLCTNVNLVTGLVDLNMLNYCEPHVGVDGWPGGCSHRV